MAIFGDYFFDHRNMKLVRYQKEDDNQTTKEHKASEAIGKREQLALVDSFPFQIHGINEIGINLTNNCNCRCNYCMDSAENGKDDFLLLDDIMAFVKKGAELRAIKKYSKGTEEPLRIYFTGGGEQTICWELFSNTVETIIDFCGKNSIPVEFGLTTNGVLSAEKIDFIAKRFSRVMISYDGNPMIQNRNRPLYSGKDTAIYVERSIEAFLTYSNLEVTIRTTVWPEDSNQLQSMHGYMRKRFGNCFLWEINPVFSMGRAKKDFSTENDQYHAFVDAYLGLIGTIPLEEQHKTIQSVFPIEQHETNCGACSNNYRCLWLIPEHKIVTCIESFSNYTQVGEIRNKKVVWYDKVIDPIMTVCLYRKERCVECIAYPFCKGGCPLRYLSHSEESICEMLRYFWKCGIDKMMGGDEWFGWYLEYDQIQDSYSFIRRM